MSSLFVSSAAGLLACLSGMAAAQEAKPAPTVFDGPALQGIFGVPGLGRIVPGGVVWHQSGQIISMESKGLGISPLSLWKANVKTMQADRVSALKTGAAWCISQKGDLLCARAPQMDDQPGLDPEKDSAALTEGAFGCYRIQDGTRLWKLPMREKEAINGAIYTLDDKKVAVLSTWNEQMSLRLLDAASGALLQQHDFPGRTKSHSFTPRRLMIRGGELWMPHLENGRQVLLRFSLATLHPTTVDCPPLEHLKGFARLSPDARRIVSHTAFDLTCLEFRNGKWEQAFENSDFQTEGDSETGTLHDVEFTPDGQRLVMITNDSARVLDFATGKEQRIKLNRNFGGSLSPNGGHLLVAHPHGLKIISLRETDATQDGWQQQNVWKPHMLRFTGDGKTLLSVDLEGIWVWDVATRKPRAWLRSFERHVPEEHELFQTVSLISNDTEVLAEEHDDALRWKLPDVTSPPPDKPQMIAPELAFGGVRQGWNGAYPGVFANSDASWLLSTNAKRQGVIHTGLGARSSRSIPVPFPEVHPELWFFGSDDTFILHAAMSDRWKRVDLRQGTIEELPSPQGVPDPAGKSRRLVHPQPVGVLPKRQFVVREFEERFCVTSLDGKTQFPWFEAPLRGFSVPNIRAGVSQDEKRCACVVMDAARRQQNIFVWEIETGKLVGYVPLPGIDATCVALSPDGSQLACGHENTTISLWDVAKLTVPAAPAPPSPPPAPPVKTGMAPTPAAPPQGGAPAKPSTQRREHMLGSGVWDFRENGTVSKGEVLPEAGRLRLNGKEFEMKGHRLNHPGDLNRLFHAQQDFYSETAPNRADPKFHPLLDHKYPEIAAGLIHLSEGSADDVWISRQTGSPAGDAHHFLTFTDTLTNVSAQDKQVEIEFEVLFPAHTKQLVDSNFQPVVTNAEGILQIKPDAVWLAALPGPETSRAVPVFSFRSTSGAQTCRLQWKPETHSLVVHHSALLPPGDPRYLAHGLRVVFLPEGVAPDHFQVPMLTDFGKRVAFSAGPRGINFGVPEMEEFLRSMLRNASALTDEMGQGWIKNADGSLQNAAGIASAHQLWFDGAPLPGSSLGVFAHREDQDGLQKPSGVFSCFGFSLDEKVNVSRVPGHSKDQQMPIIIDRIINQQKEPRAARLDFVSSFSEPIKALYDARGQAIQPSATPRPARDFGGVLIVEFDGPTRPATLLAFYQEGAAAEPKVSWPGPKLLKLEYEVTLPPQEFAEFWHGATQRPLASFGSVTEAFTDCLPYKRVVTYKGIGRFMNVQ